MSANTEQPSLTILGGAMSGHRFVVEDDGVPSLIGSDASCSFRVDIPGVSPIHARVQNVAGILTVHDTQSPRGIYVNDDRIETEVRLRNGDVLWLGKPGDSGVVMLQCRVPSRPGTSAGDSSSPAIDPLVEATGEPTIEPTVDPIVEPMVEPTVEPDLQPDLQPDIQPSIEPNIEPEVEPTVAFPPASDPVPAAFSSERTLVQSGDDSGADAFFSPDDPPISLRVDPPPTLISPPADFEDETTEAAEPTLITAPPPTVIAPPPAPERPAPPPAPAPPPPPRPASSSPAGAIPSRRPTSPPPRATAPSAPAAPPAPRRATVPAPTGPQRAPARSGGGGSGALIGVAVAVVIGLAVGGYYFVKGRQKPIAIAPSPSGAPPVRTAEAPPTVPAEVTQEPETSTTEAVTTAPPPIEEVVTIVKPTAAASAVARPTAVASPRAANAAATSAAAAAAAAAAASAAQVASARTAGDNALAAGQYDAAVAHYDEALRIAPADEPSLAGRGRAVAARDTARKKFVPGLTSVRSSKAAKGQITGFESADVKVAGALEYSGRIDFEVQPERVTPGTAYTVRVSLTNDGKKALKIGGVEASITANGAKSPASLAASAAQVDPQGNIPLGQISGSWADGTTSWSLEVIVTSKTGDTFRATLTWK